MVGMERLDDELLAAGSREILGECLGVGDALHRRDNSAVRIPSAASAATAFSRARFGGQHGSKVRRSRSSSVVTVMLTWPLPPSASTRLSTSASPADSGRTTAPGDPVGQLLVLERRLHRPRLGIRAVESTATLPLSASIRARAVLAACSASLIVARDPRLVRLEGRVRRLEDVLRRLVGRVEVDPARAVEVLLERMMFSMLAPGPLVDGPVGAPTTNTLLRSFARLPDQDLLRQVRALVPIYQQVLVLLLLVLLVRVFVLVQQADAP